MPLLDEYNDRRKKPPADVAKRILFAVIDNIIGRRGFDWDEVAEREEKEEILETNLGIVRCQLQRDVSTKEGIVKDYNFAVWGTQGGGLVRRVKNVYIFVTKPDCPGLDVGDEMPEHWALGPANDLAREEMESGHP